MNRNSRTKTLRTICELAAIVLFVFLFMRHRLQLWIVIFGLSAILSVFLGRFYCSWICPMNTSFRLINFVFTKLKLKRFGVPSLFRKPAIRYGILVLFLGSMIAVNMLGLKLSPLLYVTLVSIGLTLFFEEAFWHRHICPFGAIFSLTSRRARYSLKISEESCIECGKCQEVCPSSSIVTIQTGKRRNTASECLACGECVDACPVSVCQFEWGSR